MPHLHVPSSQVSDVELLHLGFTPHIQTPELQVSENIPSHSALAPHLHVPKSQQSDVELVHLGFTPHIHIPEIQVFDNPVQSPFPEHAKMLKSLKM